MRSKGIWLFFLMPFLLGMAARATTATKEEPVSVTITGVEGDVLANVQAAVSIPPGTVTEGEVNLPWLERLAHQAPEKVQKAVEPFGYFDAQVSATLEKVSPKGYALQVHVELGKPVTVSEVSITMSGAGAGEESLLGLIAAFPLKKGDVLRQALYESAKETFLSRAVELGYMDAGYEVHRIAVSRSEASARIELILKTGPRYVFGEVRFSGAERYPDKFLGRYLAFERGDAFSPAALAATQLNLMNSDRFKDVVVTPDKEEARDFQVPVTIRLEPSLPKRLRFGAGYGTDTGARGSVGYKDLNVFGLGHEIEGELNISENVQGFAAGYRIPGKNVESFTGLTFTLNQEDLAAYFSRRLSLVLYRTFGFGEGRIGTAYVDVRQEDSVVAEETVNVLLVLPGIRFSLQRYDNLIRPRKGYGLGLEVRGTDPSLGSEVGLIQVIGDGKMILPLPERLSLLTRVRGAGTIPRGPLVDLPASLRFFAGGDNSVRGYSYQSLGPQDAAGTVVGGRHLLVGSIEVERALFTNWGIAAFYDVGNAFNLLDDLTLFQGAGLGIRYYTPVGAIRLDVARQIGVDDPRFHLHFTMGFQL